MLPENVYNDIHKFTIENYQTIPKLVFELNNISYMREILGKHSKPFIKESDTDFFSTWVNIYA
jgi:hypothetical protein